MNDDHDCYRIFKLFGYVAAKSLHLFRTYFVRRTNYASTKNADYTCFCIRAYTVR